MPDPSFATPLPQSTRSEVLEWRFPKPHSQYILTGRSRAAWHTSFVIPQLNLLLDAGLCVNRLRPKHIFITHGHNDHVLLSPAFVKREDPPDIYCPEGMRRVLDDFLLANTMLNFGGVIDVEDAEKYGFDVDQFEDGAEQGDRERTASQKALLNTHYTHPVRHSDTVDLKRAKGFTATAFDCDHTVPCVGYVFSQTTHRLKPEYTSTSGPDLKTLRQSGTDITAPHTVPIFAFLGDTTAATLASDPEWLQQEISVVITECSFLYEEHRAQAEKTKHTFWGDLEKVVRKWPRTTFVLMHFSMRYSDREITAFFRDMEDCPRNIVVWADEEA